MRKRTRARSAAPANANQSQMGRFIDTPAELGSGGGGSLEGHYSSDVAPAPDSRTHGRRIVGYSGRPWRSEGTSMKLTDFKALTFDCYGTLIDWESGMIEALTPLTRRVDSSLGRPLSHDRSEEHTSELQ